MKKVFITLCFALLAASTFAFPIVINRTTLDHSPGGNYDKANRKVKDKTTTVDGVETIQGREVFITCSGNGDAVCPTELAIPATDGPPINIPINVLNFSQSAFDTYCGDIDTYGTVPSTITTTILGNDSNYYVLVISGSVDAVTNEIVATLTLDMI